MDAEATDIEAAVKRRGFLACIDDEGKGSKEEDKGLNSFKDLERIEDEKQVLEHEALDHGWAWLVLLGTLINGVSSESSFTTYVLKRYN